MDNKITATFLHTHGFTELEDDMGIHRLKIPTLLNKHLSLIEVDLLNQLIQLARVEIRGHFEPIYQCPNCTITALKDFHKGLTGTDLKMNIRPGCVVTVHFGHYLVLSDVEDGIAKLYSLHDNAMGDYPATVMSVIYGTLEEYYMYAFNKIQNKQENGQ